MSYSSFRRAFAITADNSQPGASLESQGEDPDLSFFLTEFGGKTFNEGIYRVIRKNQMRDAISSVESVFPEYVGRLKPFGYDWLGRYFAIDLACLDKGVPQVLMLEPGAGEAMRIPVGIVEFHEVELVQYAQDALSVSFFEEWVSVSSRSPLFDECVGYKTPLFLGGDDSVSNLEIVNLDVYLEICGQLRNGK